MQNRDGILKSIQYQLANDFSIEETTEFIWQAIYFACDRDVRKTEDKAELISVSKLELSTFAQRMETNHRKYSTLLSSGGLPTSQPVTNECWSNFDLAAFMTAAFVLGIFACQIISDLFS